MICRTALTTLLFSLPFGLSSPAIASDTNDIRAIFEATCGSGATTAANLSDRFEAQGFTADWRDDTYGYFTRAGFTANYHIYPGSWTCFVSSQSAAAPDLCEAFAAHGAEDHARLRDGTCVIDLPAHGLTVLVRNICPDSSHGACSWVQATRTADRECHVDEGFALAALSRNLVVAE